MKNQWIDAHCHLADLRSEPFLDLWIEQAKENGISDFIQGGVGPEDWLRQKTIQARYPGVHCVFGLHPYWVSGHSQAECETAVDALARELHSAVALGELGLDFRSQYLEAKNLQIEMFECQLELSKMESKPIVLHLVRCHPEALQILKLWEVSNAGGLVHSFNGNWSKAKDFLDLGLTLSIGGAVTYERNVDLWEAVKKIPSEFLVLETDSPDQPGESYKGQLHPPAGLIEIANAVSIITGRSSKEILDRNRDNLRKLFSL